MNNNETIIAELENKVWKQELTIKEALQKARAEGFKDGRLSAFKEVKQLAEVRL